MKKVALLVMDHSKEEALERIRELGVLHLEKKTVASQTLSHLADRYSKVEHAEGILDSFASRKGGSKAGAETAEPPQFEGDLVTHVIALSERLKTLQDYIFANQREMSRFERWGEFNPRDFAYLSGHGVNAQLYELPLDSYKSIVKDVPVIILAVDKKNNAVRVLAFNNIPDRPHYPLPEVALSVVEERKIFQQYEMAKIEEELSSLSCLKKRFEDEKKSVLANIEFETARAGMEQIKVASKAGASDGHEHAHEYGHGHLHGHDHANASDLSVSWISGFVPAPDMGMLKRAASENGWALYADDPPPDDTEIPTKLKNGRFASLFYPVADFLELIPGYRETDVSFWVLIFFTLFFAMIFGDAAYGVILLLIALAGIAKTRKKGVPAWFKFLLLVSAANVVWGTLVGSWFGLDVARLPRFLQNLSLPLIALTTNDPGWLASYNAGNFWIRSGLVAAQTTVEAMHTASDTNLMLFCFTIGLVQLGIAHIRNAIGCIRSLKVFAEIGRLGMVLGMYFVILSLVVYDEGFTGVQPWQLYSLAGGFVLVFLFGAYEGDLLKSIATSGANIITVLLHITNVFSDIMSYIRLWAVGLAAASIAGMVNGFADPLFSHLAFFIIGVAFFAFGHCFNMVLNVLAVLIHGVRLNTLEFSSHVGLTWSGFAYKPFAKR